MAKLSSPSVNLIVNSLSLWREYVDPNALMTADEFEALTSIEKYKMMADGGMNFTIRGADAIEYAERNGLTLNKYADPIEDARDGVTIEDAVDIMHVDPSLIYLQIGTSDEDEE
jgi:hypothetical protein